MACVLMKMTMICDIGCSDDNTAVLARPLESTAISGTQNREDLVCARAGISRDIHCDGGPLGIFTCRR
jgi:hypothetical protein